MHSLKIQYRALKICFVFVTFDERHTAMKVLYHMKYDWCIKSNIINWCHFQRGNISNDMSCVMDIVVYLHFINYKIPLAVNLLAMMNPNPLFWFSPFNKPKNDRPNILNKFSFGRIKLACYATVPHLWHQRQLDKDQWMPGIWIETQNYLSRNWLVDSPRYEPQSYWWTDGLLALFVIHRSGEFFVLFCFLSGQLLSLLRNYFSISSNFGPFSFLYICVIETWSSQWTYATIYHFWCLTWHVTMSNVTITSFDWQMTHEKEPNPNHDMSICPNHSIYL